MKHTYSHSCLSLAIFVFLNTFILLPAYAAPPNPTQRGTLVDVDINETLIEKPLYSGSYALIIGVSEYTAGYDKLPGVKKDRIALKKYLTTAGFDKVILLADPTKQELKDGVESFIAQYGRTKDNRLLIFYSGHGETLTHDDGLKRGYVVPRDAPLKRFDQNGFLDKAVSMYFFETKAREISAKHVLFVFDSCFSGSIFSAMRGQQDLTAEIKVLAEKPVRQFIAAGSENQLVPDYSIFRRYLETGLSGDADLNQDGFITGTELGFYLRSKVANDSDGKQTPLFARMLRDGFYEGDIIFRSPIGGRNEITQKKQTSKNGTFKRSGTADESLQKTFQFCELCPEMVSIPEGSFLIGANENDPDKSPEELPQKEILLNKFAISRYEITQSQWDTCFMEGGCSSWLPGSDARSSFHPVSGVSWQDANEYCDWLSRKAGQTFYLPSESQWEYAARAGAGSSHPWGEKLGENRANCRECGSKWDTQGIAPVGKFQPNRFGLYDVLGNVWEWTRDCYISGHQLTPIDGSPLIEKNCINRTLKGGSFTTSAPGVRTPARSGYPHDKAAANFGFRVAMDIVQ